MMKGGHLDRAGAGLDYEGLHQPSTLLVAAGHLQPWALFLLMKTGHAHLIAGRLQAVVHGRPLLAGLSQPLPMFSAANCNERVSKGGSAVRLFNEPLQVVQRRAEGIVLKKVLELFEAFPEGPSVPSGDATRALRDFPGTSFADFLP
jgi:hypothetical protein